MKQMTRVAVLCAVLVACGDGADTSHPTADAGTDSGAQSHQAAANILAQRDAAPMLVQLVVDAGQVLDAGCAAFQALRCEDFSVQSAFRCVDCGEERRCLCAPLANPASIGEYCDILCE